jgi:ATP-dependent protease ClpP protease subunit
MNAMMMQEKRIVTVQSQEARVFILQLSNLTDEEYIEDVLREFHEAGITPNDRLEIHINCPGGSLYLTLHFIHTVVMLFGSNIATFITSHAFSAAAFVFMIGSQRFVYEDSSLMLHTFSSWVDGKSGDIKNDIEFSLEWFERMFDRYFGRYLSEEEKSLIAHGKDTYFNAEQMLERGIATNLIRITFGEEENEEQEGE